MCNKNKDMKVWNILIVVLLVACNKAQEKGFVKIELDPIDRDKIIQSIIPDKKYVYWEYGRIDMIRDSYTIRIVGDSAFKKLIIKPY